MATNKYNHQAARLPEQAQQMQDLAARGVCAFCPQSIRNETKEPIEIETEHWFVKRNDYPYERTSHHFLLIPKEHVHTISELSAGAQEEFLTLSAKVEKKFALPSYAVAIRSGDMRYNGGSVEHLHAHIIVGDAEHPDDSPVRFKVSSRPSKD